MRIFSGQNREQYMLEGLIISAVTIAAALSMVGLHYVTKIRYSLLRHVGVIFLMSVFVVLSIEIFSFYTEKTRWYNLKDTLPSYVWSWITSTVKKNSGLPKRLLRVSEYYLFEYKDWSGLKKKVQVLLVDYVQRTFLSRFGWDSTASTSK